MKFIFTNDEFFSFLKKIKEKINNKKERLHFKYILKEDEFHSSLDFDGKEWLKDKKKYEMDLIKRRDRAHELDILNSKGEL